MKLENVKIWRCYETGEPNRHPAVVVNQKKNKVFEMVPFSHSERQGTVRLRILEWNRWDGEKSFALLKLLFKASKPILEVSSLQDNRSITDDDLRLLQKRLIEMAVNRYEQRVI